VANFDGSGFISWNAHLVEEEENYFDDDASYNYRESAAQVWPFLKQAVIFVT